MANWNGFVLTHVGAELQAKVNAGLTDLVFTKVALGDGTATGDLQNLTDLVSRKKDLTISDISVSANVVIVKSIITNENLQTGFYMREMGLYATDPDDGEILYAVMVDTNPDYMPADGSATVVSELLTLNLTMSNTGNVSATLDASQLIHRSEFFDLLIEKLASALPMTISSLNTNSVFYRLLQYALNAAGVQYNFTNANAWYICLGALFGGLIIQGGMSNTSINGQHTVNFPVSYASVPCIVHAPVHESFLGYVLLSTITDSATTNSVLIDVRYISTSDPAPATESLYWLSIGC